MFPRTEAAGPGAKGTVVATRDDSPWSRGSRRQLVGSRSDDRYFFIYLDARLAGHSAFLHFGL